MEGEEIEEVSYEEWKTASRFARFRYKYGIIVLVLCWIALCLLIYVVWNYGYELAEHPAMYALKKIGASECYCSGPEMTYYINTTDVIIKRGGNRG